MEISYPTRVLVRLHNGQTIEARCLRCSDRERFLSLRTEAWQRMEADTLAQVPQDHIIGIAHLFDRDEAFRWLCYEMLMLHGIDGRQVDLPQLIELLFRSEHGDGSLVRLQFPPMPPGAPEPEPTDEEEKPYYRLMATLAYQTGDWFTAKQALDTLRYDEVVSLSQALAAVAKERSSSTPETTAAPSPSRPQSRTATTKLEQIKQQARERFKEGAEQRQSEALQEAIQRHRQQSEKL